VSVRSSFNIIASESFRARFTPNHHHQSTVWLPVSAGRAVLSLHSSASDRCCSRTEASRGRRTISLSNRSAVGWVVKSRLFRTSGVVAPVRCAGRRFCQASQRDVETVPQPKVQQPRVIRWAFGGHFSQPPSTVRPTINCSKCRKVAHAICSGRRCGGEEAASDGWELIERYSSVAFSARVLPRRCRL
jgi:hypothetical protein